MKTRELFSEQIKTYLLQSPNNIVEKSVKVFSIGYKLDAKGAASEADEFYRSVIEVLEVIRSSKESPSALSEADLAACAFNHGSNLLKLGRVWQARVAFKFSADSYDRLTENGVSASFVERLAQSLRWLAITQQKTGDFAPAANTFKRVIALYRSLIVFSGTENRRTVYNTMIQSAVQGYKKATAAMQQARENAN